MAQYQSFPDAAGASRTLEKLRGLLLPDLAGRSFLDVGCNEGFFCGFAKSAGASRVVGVDQSALFIERARQRFPGCEFHQQGWDTLPGGPFDIILLASALHYADDQPALLHRLVEHLSPDGVLVLELGIVSSAKSEWVKIDRDIDQREFPTMPKLREILRDYAWKWMGRSVQQGGDPVPRHVVHISRRRPLAYLLMQPPGYGKTSIAERLFAPSDVPVVSGDLQIALIAQAKREASPRLRRLAKQDYSPFQLDRTIQAIFDRGAGDDLVDVWIAQAGAGDFAIDAYVPVEHQASVESRLLALGYLPIVMRWEKVGARMLPAEAIDQQAEAFYQSLRSPDAPRPQVDPAPSRGYVDELTVQSGRLVIRGWAVDASGALPRRLGVRIKGRTHYVDEFEKLLRPDVQKHLDATHALLGYRATLEVPGVEAIDDLIGGFEVFLPDAGTMRFGPAVAKLLRPAR